MALHVAIAARDDAGDARWLSLGTEGDEAAIRLLAGVVKERELLVLELVDARAQLYSLRAGGSDRCLSASLESLSLAVAPRRLPPPREQLWTLEATADGRRTLRAAVDGTLVAPAADGRGLVRGAAAGARPFTFSVVVGAVLGAVSASAQRAMDGAELALWSAATQRWVSLRPTHLFGFGGEVRRLGEPALAARAPRGACALPPSPRTPARRPPPLRRRPRPRASRRRSD